MLACPIKDITIEKGAEFLAHYKRNTRVATQHFHSVCGIMTDHQRRTTQEIFGVNIGYIDEIDYTGYKTVPMNNGVSLYLENESD